MIKTSVLSAKFLRQLGLLAVACFSLLVASNAALAAEPGAQDSPAEAAAGQPAPPTEEQRVQAAQEIEQGQAAYKAGDYAAAVAHFNQANALAPSATAQLWLAMSLDLQGDAAAAITAFEALFDDPGRNEIVEEQLASARDRLSVLRQIPASVTFSVHPADAVLTIDGVPQSGTSPFSLKLASGKHAVALSKEGFQGIETEIEVKPAETFEKTFELVAESPAVAEPVAPVEPAPVPVVEPRSKLPAYITLGVAGASAIVGTLFGIQALSAKSDFDSRPTARNADNVERSALIADMAFGVAFTLGITGVVLLTADEPAEAASSRRAPPSTLALTPYVSPQGGGGAARLTF